MELKERILTILMENDLKQKELATLMGVSDSYISALLAGRNQKVSVSVANMIENNLGYSVEWVLTGKEPKYKISTYLSKDAVLSDVHRQVIMRIEKMSESEVIAVLAFIKTLEELNQKTDQRSP